MKNQEVVSYATYHSFKNDEGQLVEGGKMFILGKRVDVSNDFGVKVGNPTGEFKVAKAVAEKVCEKGPGIYNVEYDVSINRDNAVVLIPKDVEFVRELKLLP